MNTFLRLVPTKAYEEELGKTPEDREPKTLARYFVALTKKDPDLVTRIIVQFVKKEIEIIQEGKMSPNTLPNHVKPIKALEANDVAIPWKSIYKMYPRGNPATDDRASNRRV